MTYAKSADEVHSSNVELAATAPGGSRGWVRLPERRFRLGAAPRPEQPAKQGTIPPGPLDAVATVLLTAITTTASAFTLMGVNSERTWLLLDEDKSRGSLMFATVSAIIAVAIAMASYFFRRHVGIKSVLLWIGVGA